MTMMKIEAVTVVSGSIVDFQIDRADNDDADAVVLGEWKRKQYRIADPIKLIGLMMMIKALTEAIAEGDKDAIR